MRTLRAGPQWTLLRINYLLRVGSANCHESDYYLLVKLTVVCATQG